MPLQTNYGGILQIMALQDFLRSNGYDAIIIDRRYSESGLKRFLRKMIEQNGIFDYKNISLRKRIARRIEEFIRKELLPITKPIFSDAELKREVKTQKFDSIVVGSDQVWRPTFMQSIWRNYFLDFVDDPKIKKIAYAPSFGKDNWDHPDKTQEIKALLKRFNAVSVREESGTAICSKFFDHKDAQLVVDPTLLVDKRFYQQFLPKEKEPTDNIGIFAYMLDEENKNKEILTEAQRYLDLPVYSIIARHQSEVSEKKKGFMKPSPVKWIDSFFNADFVITDSYHGTIFSIIFKKPFLVIANEHRGTSRLESLLGRLGLMERLIYDPKTFDAAIFRKVIDYELVDQSLRPWVEMSRSFLINSLEKAD